MVSTNSEIALTKNTVSTRQNIPLYEPGKEYWKIGFHYTEKLLPL